MKKIVVFLLVVVMISYLSIPCQAETLLTYYDTVVIKPYLDVAEENIISVEYKYAESSEKNSSLKEIMKRASNTFFQK